MQKLISIFFILAQLGLGGLFLYAGVRKFIPNPARTASTTEVVPGSTEDQMRKFIGGLKATSYFWPFLGTVEILAGLFLLSQFYAVLGAFLLIPVTSNIFLFHVFLKPGDLMGGILAGIYFLLNLIIIFRKHKILKQLFITPKPFYL